MNVTVFGATGAIGRFAVAALLTSGHTVTAYARDPAKVPAEWTDRVRVEIGEITDGARIDAAVAEAGAVVSTLGPSMAKSATGLPLVDGTRLILESMQRHGVRRFVGNGTPSVRDVRDRGLRPSLIGALARTILPRAYAEMMGMSALITASDRDWTIVRFTAPVDGPRTGRLRVGFFGRTRLGMKASRADIGAFTAAQVNDDRFIRAAPAISA